MNNGFVKELLGVAKELIEPTTAAFVDQPVPWGDEKGAELEQVRDEAEEKLAKSLDMVKNRYYWSPGRSVMINITLTGRPLFHEYRMGGLHGVGYRNGVLTVNPQWISTKDSFASYEWGYVVDKMIRIVKQSEKIDKKMKDILDKVEKKLGFDIPKDVKADIVLWCVKAAKRRLSARAYPSPRGKEFIIKEESA